MAAHPCTGIDIGTHHVKVVITEPPQERNTLPRIIGTGIAESRGLRHGYIVNTSEVTTSVRHAIAQAEKKTDVRVEEAFISIGGVGLESVRSSGTAAISKGDGEVTATDIANALETSEQNIPKPQLQNRRVVHPIPLSYRIDSESVLGDPVGMNGLKLEVETLFVTALEKHVNELVDAVEEAGIEVLDVMASPLAAGLVTLAKSQRVAGCVLANIGAETVSIVVYENDVPISLEVFPLGSSDITNDIALGLKVSLEEAQKIKHGETNNTRVPQRKLNEIITARLKDIFELIEAHLDTIKRNKILPAGIIITGGGAALPRITENAKETLQIPARLGDLTFAQRSRPTVQGVTWAVAYGLTVFGFSSDARNRSIGRGTINRALRTSLSWVRQFLP